jgi:hypothetical protein
MWKSDFWNLGKDRTESLSTGTILFSDTEQKFKQKREEGQLISSPGSSASRATVKIETKKLPTNVSFY